jgi:hypothetical protein
MTLISQVDRCQHLLADHLAAAVQVFGSAALGVIDLPPLSAPGRVAPAQLRAAATMYWCMCVDNAGLLDFVDALADAVWEGRLLLPNGDGATRLAEYRRERDDDRFTKGERRTIYDRLFGGDFPAQWDSLIDELCELGSMPVELGTGSVMARISVAAQALAQGLSDRAIGIVAFAGREIVGHVRAALQLMRDPEIGGGLGGGGVWQIIRHHAPTLLGHPVSSGTHVERAQAGLTILEWLAARASAIEAGALVVGRADPIVRAAVTWRAAGAPS